MKRINEFGFVEPSYETWRPYLSNTEKGRLGEDAVEEALCDFPLYRNIMFGKRQNDVSRRSKIIPLK